MPPVGEESVESIMRLYDEKTTLLGEFPAKDVINELTKIAEDFTLAEAIVSFMQQKIRMVRSCARDAHRLGRP